MPLVAQIVLRLSCFTAWRASLSHGSISNPLYTTAFACVKNFRSPAFGSKSCASTPGGIMVWMYTLSFPTISVSSFIASKVAATAIFPSVFFSVFPPAKRFTALMPKNIIQTAEKNNFFMNNTPLAMLLAN